MATPEPSSPNTTPTITFSVDSLDSSAVHTLTSLWDRLGHTPDDTSAALTALSHSIRDVYTTAIHRAHDDLAAERRHLRHMSQRVHELSSELAPRAPDTPTTSPTPSEELPDVPLRAQTALLRDRMAALESLRGEILARVRAKHHALLRLWTHDLGEALDDLSVRFRDAAAASSDDIHPRWEADLDAELAQLRAVVDERRGYVEACLARVAALLGQLGDLSAAGREGDAGTPQAASNVDAAARAMAEGTLDLGAFGVARHTIVAIAARETALSEQLEENTKRLGELRDKARRLYQALRVPDSDWEAFSHLHSGFGYDQVTVWQDRVAELTLDRKERIGQLIQDQRDRIEQLHAELMSPDAELNNDVQGLLDEEESEEVLQRYEKKVAEIEARAAKVQPILALMARRRDTREARASLEEAMKDPNRLNTKNGRLDQAKLRREQVIRKKIDQLPELEKELLKKLHEFEAASGTPFMTKNGALLKVIKAEIEADNIAKQQAKERRAAEKQARIQEEYFYGSRPQARTPTTANKSNNRSHGSASKTLRDTNRSATPGRFQSRRTPSDAKSFKSHPRPTPRKFSPTQTEPWSPATRRHVAKVADENESPLMLGRSITESFNHFVLSDTIDEDSVIVDELRWAESPIPSRVCSAQEDDD